MITIYGIANCDKCRAARKWFSQQDIAHQFHDVRKDGLTASIVQEWLQQAGTDTVINRRGKTWKEIPTDIRDNLDANLAAELILEHPTLTKRPVIDTGSEILVGYDEPMWLKAFKS